jgi:hypothetical protein
MCCFRMIVYVYENKAHAHRLVNINCIRVCRMIVYVSFVYTLENTCNPQMCTLKSRTTPPIFFFSSPRSHGACWEGYLARQRQFYFRYSPRVSCGLGWSGNQSRRVWRKVSIQYIHEHTHTHRHTHTQTHTDTHKVVAE